MQSPFQSEATNVDLWGQGLRLANNLISLINAYNIEDLISSERTNLQTTQPKYCQYLEFILFLKTNKEI